MRRTVVLAAALAAVILFVPLAACIPFPVHPGYIDLATKGRGRLDLTGAVGGQGNSLGGGLGGVQLGVDPYLTERLSLPVGLIGGLGSYGAGVTGGVAARLGVRYRLAPPFALGTGLGGGYYGWGYSGLASHAGGLHLDVEAVIGGRWGDVGLSVTARPTFEVLGPFFFLPVEAALVIHLSSRASLTLHAYGGPIVEMEPDPWAGGWGGGAIGFMMAY
jgi:hypothetical protein